MNDTLAEVIARVRKNFRYQYGFSDSAAWPFIGDLVKVADLTAILDAAEAGMRARNEALEEAAEKAADVVVHHLGSDGDVVAAAIRSLKEKTNG